MTLLLNGAIAPGFVALRRGDAAAWERLPLELGRGAPFVGAVVEQLLAGAPLAQLRRVAVVRGPGSSTGVRMACSYANGIALVSGAQRSILSSFELASLLLPGAPGEIVFPQPMGRSILARRSAAGEWLAPDVTPAPTDVPTWDAAAQAAATARLDGVLFDALLAASTAVDVVTPLYWIPPKITRV